MQCSKLFVRRHIATLFAVLLMAGTVHAQQRPAAPAARPTVNPAERVQAFFARLDKNKDGILDKEEIPEPLAARLGSMDRDRDGKITAREFSARFQQPTRSAASRDNHSSPAADRNNVAPQRPSAGRGGASRSGRAGAQPPATRDNNAAPQRPSAGRSGGSRSGGRSGSQQGQQNRQHDGSTPSRGGPQAQQGQRGPQKPGQRGPQAQQGQRGPQKPGQHGPQAQQGQRGPQKPGQREPQGPQRPPSRGR